MKFMPWLALLAVAYINLIPFNVRPMPVEEAIELFRHLKWQHIFEEDRGRWISNVMQFMPLGFFTCGVISKRSVVLAAIFTICLGFVVAASLEFAQIWFPPRTVAPDDITAETIGTVLGVIVWFAAGRQILRTISIARSGGPEALLAGLYLYLGLYAFALLHPFDFVASPAELGARLTDPQAILIARVSHLGLVDIATLLLKIAVMLPAGGAIRLIWRRGPLFAAVGIMAFAWMIEIVHLFERSAVMNWSNVLIAGFGAALGNWLVTVLSRVDDGLAMFARPAALIAFPFYAIALIVLRDWHFGLADPRQVWETFQALHWVPLYYEYFAPSNQNAFASGIRIALAFAPVGVMFWAIQLQRFAGSNLSMPVLPAAVAGATLCGIMEAGRLVTADLRPDPTNVLIAAFAAAVAQFVCEWAWRVVRDSRRRRTAW